MQNDKENGGFKFTYSAKEQAEIKRIRDKYTKDEKEDKMAYLRRLDAGVTQTAMTVSLIFGIVGTLIMGFGMSIIMSELGDVFREAALPLGVGIGILGGAIAGLAYPMYNVIIKRQRAKIAPEIISLTDELMKQ